MLFLIIFGVGIPCNALCKPCCKNWGSTSWVSRLRTCPGTSDFQGQCVDRQWGGSMIITFSCSEVFRDLSLSLPPVTLSNPWHEQSRWHRTLESPSFLAMLILLGTRTSSRPVSLWCTDRLSQGASGLHDLASSHARASLCTCPLPSPESWEGLLEESFLGELCFHVRFVVRILRGIWREI